MKNQTVTPFLGLCALALAACSSGTLDLPDGAGAIPGGPTGTGGDDPVVNAVLQAPTVVYGYKYVRASVRNKVATGGVADTWVISYSFLRIDLV